MPYIRNKATGETIFVPDAGPSAIPVGPPNPKFPYEGPQAAASLTQTGASTASTQANTARTNQEMQQSAGMFADKRREATANATLAELNAQKAELARQQAAAEAEAKNPLNAQGLQAISTDAMAKLRTIDRINQNINTATLPAVGLGAETVAGYGGTNARDVRTDIGSLKAGGALSEVLKMSQATGRNPFSPMSNSDVDLVSNNIANLDQGQSRPNFSANLDNYKRAYTNAYAGAEGMRALKGEIARLLPSIPPAKRQSFQDDALRRYNEAMARKASQAGSQHQNSTVIDFNDWGH